MDSWTPAFELEYWMAHEDAFYLQSVQTKWDLFGVGSLLGLETVVDVGGGKFGGALGLVEHGPRKFLADALADTFAKWGGLPADVCPVGCDFGDLHLESGTVDVLFAWNVYDHADNDGHFQQGLCEAVRVLRDGGLFLGTFPLRVSPTRGHPICLTEARVRAGLGQLRVRRSFRVREPYYTDEVLFVEAVR